MKHPIAIVGAMQEEIELLVTELTNKQSKNYFGFEFHTGELNGQAVVLLLSGIGKVSAAIGITLLKEHYNPRFVINTGSAGGLTSQHAIGDLVISTAVSYYDVDVTAFNYTIGQVPRMPAHYFSDKTLVAAAEQAAQRIKGITTYKGLVVSGDSFICDGAQLATIKNHFPEAFALEMEAGGIAQACHQLQIPFVIIRAISDSADDEAKLTHEEFLAIAAKHSALLVKTMLIHIKTIR